MTYQAKLAPGEEGNLNEDFAGRVMSFDGEVAGEYAEINASQRAEGRPISQIDATSAAITRSHGASLATRNAKDFEDCGISVEAKRPQQAAARSRAGLARHRNRPRAAPARPARPQGL